MAAEVLTICRAIVDHLNGGSYLLPVEAERQMRPDVPLLSIGTSLVVVVYPKTVEQAPGDRSRWVYLYEFLLTVQKRLTIDPTDPVDGVGDQFNDMEELMQQLLDRLRVVGGRPLADYPNASLVAIEQSDEKIATDATPSMANFLLYTAKARLRFRELR